MHPFRSLRAKIVKTFGKVKNLLLFFCVLPLLVNAQVSWNFESGGLSDWKQLPAGRWEITPDNAIEGCASLHHRYDNPSRGIDGIWYTHQYPLLSDTLRFLFRIRHGYPPSSINNWQFHCLATSRMTGEAKSAGGQAIVLGVNADASDDQVKIWQVNGTTYSVVASSDMDYQEQVGIEGTPWFQLVRYPGGWWVASWKNDTLSPWKPLCSGMEKMPPSGKYMGFRYSYSSSQDRKLWVDDVEIHGSFFRDTIPPELISASLESPYCVFLRFSESLHSASILSVTRNGQSADSVHIIDDFAEAWFREPFENRTETPLSVTGALDRECNRMRDTITVVILNLAEFGDVVINEVMVDPTPRVYLPAHEYVELYNRSEFSLNLENWNLAVNARSYSLPDVEIVPDSFVVLLQDDAEDEFPGKTVPVMTSSTALTNGGATIRLVDPYHRLIHVVTYPDPGILDAGKAEGGWSLEYMAPDAICAGTENWAFSTHWKGGTPCAVNSVYSKMVEAGHYPRPVIKSYGFDDSVHLRLWFSDPVMLRRVDTLFLTGGDTIRGISETAYMPTAGGELVYRLDRTLHRGTSYILDSGSWTTCKGEDISQENVLVCMPEKPRNGDLLINEVMYDPLPGGLNYVEWVNVSGRPLDVRDLKWAFAKQGGYSAKEEWICDRSLVIEPGAYFTVTASPFRLMEAYHLTGRDLLFASALAGSMNRTGGCITLFDRSGLPIDHMCYSDSLHMDWCDETTGIALERIGFGCSGSDPACWHSASFSSGFGTPCRRNSQFLEEELSEDKLTLAPPVFSPDNDGFEDVLSISVRHSPEGLITIEVYSLGGIRVRTLVNNGILGAGDYFYWDGRGDSGRRVFPGIYAIRAVIMEQTGKRKVFWKSCAVIYR